MPTVENPCPWALLAVIPPQILIGNCLKSKEIIVVRLLLKTFMLQ